MARKRSAPAKGRATLTAKSMATRAEILEGQLASVATRVAEQGAEIIELKGDLRRLAVLLGEQLEGPFRHRALEIVTKHQGKAKVGLG